MDDSQGFFPLSWWSVPSRDSHAAFPHKRILSRRLVSQKGLLNSAVPSRVRSRGHASKTLLIRRHIHDRPHRILVISHITTQKMHPIPSLALRSPTHSSTRHIHQRALSPATRLQIDHERRLIAPPMKQNGIAGISQGMSALARRAPAKPTTESLYRSQNGPQPQALPRASR